MDQGSSTQQPLIPLSTHQNMLFKTRSRCQQSLHISTLCSPPYPSSLSSRVLHFISIEIRRIQIQICSSTLKWHLNADKVLRGIPSEGQAAETGHIFTFTVGHCHFIAPEWTWHSFYVIIESQWEMLFILLVLS